MPKYDAFIHVFYCQIEIKMSEMFGAESYIMWHLNRAVGVTLWCMLRIWWETILLTENNTYISTVLDTEKRAAVFIFTTCICKYNKPNQLKTTDEKL